MHFCSATVSPRRMQSSRIPNVIVLHLQARGAGQMTIKLVKRVSRRKRLLALALISKAKIKRNQKGKGMRNICCACWVLYDTPRTVRGGNCSFAALIFNLSIECGKCCIAANHKKGTNRTELAQCGFNVEWRRR